MSRKGSWDSSGNRIRAKQVLHKPVFLKGSQKAFPWRLPFQFTNEFHENVLGFCNNIYNAEGGTHLTGFKTTFTSVINTYARELGVLKEKDSNFTGADIRNGMTAVSFREASGLLDLRDRPRRN